MVKVGIIGCGKIAQVRHIPEYLDNPNAKLTGLYDLNLQRAKELAEKYHKSTVQIILRWHIQMGFGLVPGSKSMDHIKDNANIFDFELTDEEMKQIETINKQQKDIIRRLDRIEKSGSEQNNE